MFRRHYGMLRLKGDADPSSKVTRSSGVVVFPRIADARTRNSGQKHSYFRIIKIRKLFVEVQHTRFIQSLDLISHVHRVGVHSEDRIFGCEELKV